MVEKWHKKLAITFPAGIAGEGGDVGYLLVPTSLSALSSYTLGKAVCAMLFQDPKWEVSVCPCVSWQPCLIFMLCLLPQI